MPVTVKPTWLALEGRLGDDVPDVVEDYLLVFWVSKGPVVVVVRDQVFPVLRSGHCSSTAAAFHQSAVCRRNTLLIN